MTPHGPDAPTFEAAVGDAAAEQAPARIPDTTLAFMCERPHPPPFPPHTHTHTPAGRLLFLTLPPQQRQQHTRLLTQLTY